MQNINEVKIEKLAEIYKLLGNTSRLRILLLLVKGEFSASEIANVSHLSQAAASHQLKELKVARIIKSRKEGLNVFYSLDDWHITEILECGINHIECEHCNEEKI